MQSTTFRFLEAFSNVVTIHSVGQYDWLARTGSYSIYALLSKIVPEVRTGLMIENEPARQSAINLDLHRQGLLLTEGSSHVRYTPRRGVPHLERAADHHVCLGSNWVSEKIFNRFLETIGFQRIRVRTKSVVR